VLDVVQGKVALPGFVLVASRLARSAHWSALVDEAVHSEVLGVVAPGDVALDVEMVAVAVEHMMNVHTLDADTRSDEAVWLMD
jgi:hypothetical protein